MSTAWWHWCASWGAWGWVIVALPLALMAALLLGNLKFNGRAARASLAALVAVPLALGTLGETFSAVPTSHRQPSLGPARELHHARPRSTSCRKRCAPMRRGSRRRPKLTSPRRSTASMRGRRPTPPTAMRRRCPLPSTPRSRAMSTSSCWRSFWDPTPLLPKDKPTLSGEPLLDPRFCKRGMRPAAPRRCRRPSPVGPPMLSSRCCAAFRSTAGR